MIEYCGSAQSAREMRGEGGASESAVMYEMSTWGGARGGGGVSNEASHCFLLGSTPTRVRLTRDAGLGQSERCADTDLVNRARSAGVMSLDTRAHQRYAESGSSIKRSSTTSVMEGGREEEEEEDGSARSRVANSVGEVDSKSLVVGEFSARDAIVDGDKDGDKRVRGRRDVAREGVRVVEESAEEMMEERRGGGEEEVVEVGKGVETREVRLARLVRRTEWVEVEVERRSGRGEEERRSGRGEEEREVKRRRAALAWGRERMLWIKEERSEKTGARLEVGLEKREEKREERRILALA